MVVVFHGRNLLDLSISWLKWLKWKTLGMAGLRKKLEAFEMEYYKYN